MLIQNKVIRTSAKGVVYHEYVIYTHSCNATKHGIFTLFPRFSWYLVYLKKNACGSCFMGVLVNDVKIC